MYIRYKFWDRDGLRNLVVSVPGVPEGKLLFPDSNAGVLDVRNKAAIEALLGDSYNFEVAYEYYSIGFDEKGNEFEAKGDSETGIDAKIEQKPAKKAKKK